MQRLCYFCCQLRPVAPGQEVQRRIHSGRQPGRGQERAAVHIPDSTLPMNPWVNALEPVDITPMSRSRLAVDALRSRPALRRRYTRRTGARARVLAL